MYFIYLHLSANFDENINIRSLVKGRADICITKAVLHSLLYLNTSKRNLSSESFQTLSFILTANNVETFLDSSRDLCSLLNAIEDFFENVSHHQDRDMRPGLRIIETLIFPKLQVHRSISNQILSPLVRIFRGYPFDVDGSVISRILKIIRDILSRSSSICVSTFFSNAENSSDLDHLRKNLLEVDLRTTLNDIFALHQAFNTSDASKMTFRKPAQRNTIKAKLVDDDNSSSVPPTSPVRKRRQQFSKPGAWRSRPVPNLRNYFDRPPAMAKSTYYKQFNPHSRSLVGSQQSVFRSLQPEEETKAPKPVSISEKVENKPRDILIRRSKKLTDLNENEILDEAVELFQQTYLNKGEKEANKMEIEPEVESSPTISGTRKCLFNWMIDGDSDSCSSTNEDIKEQLKLTDIEVPTDTELRRHQGNSIDEQKEILVGDIKMEKPYLWNDDDVFTKTLETQKHVKERFIVKRPNIPTCPQLSKNHLLSVKHSIKAELCEAERFFEIDVGFLSSQICGMLNTVTGGSIYLGVKRNGVIKGIRLDRKQKDKVCDTTQI